MLEEKKSYLKQATCELMSRSYRVEIKTAYIDILTDTSLARKNVTIKNNI